MNTATLIGSARRELARRVSGGLEIALFWDNRDNTTTIDVGHDGTGEVVTFGVPPEQALHAYYHPFAQLWSPR